MKKHDNKMRGLSIFLLLIFILPTLLFFIPIGDTSLDVEPSLPVETSPVPVTEPPTVASEPIIEPTTEPIIPEVTEVYEEPTVPETTEEEFVSYYSYTEEELDLLARLIHSEGCSESYDTKLRIGSVVMNRVEDSKFPNTIREVIYQKSQFSVTILRVDGVLMIDQPADEESYMAAKEILDYGSVLPDTVQVFYAYYCDDPWVTSRVVYERTDNTVFAHIYS